MTGNDKANRLKVMTGASRDCAKLALDLAPADWSEMEHAKALSKDFKVVGKKMELLRQTALQGCVDGRVYVGVRDSRYAQFTHQQGRFAIEFQSPKPTATNVALNQGPAGFADKSVWEGTRKVAGANGKAIKEEKVQLLILYRVSENPSTGGGTYKAELTLDGQSKSEIQLSVNAPLAGRVSWMTVGTPRPGEQFPRGTDPYSGTIRNGIIEVLSQPTADKPNTENALIQLRLKK